MRHHHSRISGPNSKNSSRRESGESLLYNHDIQEQAVKNDKNQVLAGFTATVVSEGPLSDGLVLDSLVSESIVSESTVSLAEHQPRKEYVLVREISVNQSLLDVSQPEKHELPVSENMSIQSSSVSCESQVSLLIDELKNGKHTHGEKASFSDKIKLFEKRGSLIEPKNAFGVNPVVSNPENSENHTL